MTKITQIWYQTSLDAFFGFYTFMTFSFIGFEWCEQAFKLLRLGQGNTYNPGVEAAEAESFHLWGMEKKLQQTTCHIIYCEMLWRAVQKCGDVSTVTHYLEIRELKQGANCRRLEGKH